MAPVNKILSHPDKEEIIQWITKGISVREIERRLKEKYPKDDQKHLQIAFSTIQSFKKMHLNLKGKVLDDIKQARKETLKWANQKDIELEVKKSLSYQEAIKDLANKELDTRNEILKVWTILEAQISKLFDKLDDHNYVDKDVHKVMQGYLNQFMNVIDQYKKYEEGYRETVDVNVNVNVMSEQIGVLREAIRDTFADVDPELTMQFMARLNEKMKALTMKGNRDMAERHSQMLDAALGHRIEEVDFE